MLEMPAIVFTDNSRGSWLNIRDQLRTDNGWVWNPSKAHLAAVNQRPAMPVFWAPPWEKPADDYFSSTTEVQAAATPNDWDWKELEEQSRTTSSPFESTRGAM